MIKKTLFGIIVLILVSCGIDHTDFSGDWIDKKNESDRMIIKKNGDNYIVENRAKKYPAQINDGLLEISTELPIKAAIDDKDNLIVGGKEYIRFENSKTAQLIGKWKEQSEQFYRILEISLDDNNQLIFDFEWEENGEPSMNPFGQNDNYYDYSVNGIKGDNFQGKCKYQESRFTNEITLYFELIYNNTNEIKFDFKSNNNANEKFIRI